MWDHVTFQAKWFTPDEFECRCCGTLLVEPDLVRLCDRLRNRLGTPITVVSGFRCVDHNRAVGGAVGSYHLQGRAADLRLPKHEGLQFLMLQHGMDVGFGGVGIYRNFIHFDTGPRRIWTT